MNEIKKRKIMWLCNARFSKEKIRTTASWLQPLAECLQQLGKVDIVNVTTGNVRQTICEEIDGIKQYVLPMPSVSHYGQVPSREFCLALSKIEGEVKPDLVHVWGTEGIWASAFQQGAIKTKAFLDIQGILSSYYYYYYGGLTFWELLRCVHLKEILMPWRNLCFKKRIFKKRGEVEIEAIKSFDTISYQSEWVRRHLSFVAPTARFISTKIMLRKSFYTADAWKYKCPSDSPVVFTTASGSIPYKGIQVLMKSIQLLKDKYPGIQLRIAGNMHIGNRLQDGFSVYIQNLIKRLGIQNNVVELGPIDETQIVKELQGANVCVIPSFVETYCLAFAESMIVGTPTIASFAGAMPELARHEEECLFYNSIDFQVCASFIDRLVQDRSLAERLSENGRARRMKENDMDTVVKTQQEIYNKVLENEHI